MSSPNYSRFIESMKIGYMQWHDGTGYDLEALAIMEDDERRQVEEVLLRHLDNPGDWRDIEALQALGTPRALEAVRAAANHRNPEVHVAALRQLIEPEPGEKIEESLEDSVVRSLKDACSLGGLAALDIAQQCPTPRVKKALLDCARLGSPEVRVNAAAMLLYVCGQAKEPFDWEQRPFFLQFRTENSRELRVCWEELRKRAGI